MRKKELLILLFLLFLTSGLILPNQTSVLGAVWVPPAQYQVLEGVQVWLNTYLKEASSAVASGIVAAFSSVLIAITLPFLELSQEFFSWAISSDAINISFTGADNIVVTEGWGIVRNLTNILIVLGLIVIALATILRIQSYQMKKTLPLLLIVALLINFTPMLCGLVIDASNIIMDYFLEGGALLTQDFLSKISTQFTNLWNLKMTPINTLAKGMVFVGFNILAGLIFLLFACLFLLRYIALWIIVILSPFALFCYIFPGTKKIWDQWLSQFTQWCFIGIPAAFTIYLANIMTDQLLKGNLIGEASGMGMIMGYLVPLAFLYGGLIMTFKTKAMGADLAIKGFKLAGTAAGGLMIGAAVGAGATAIGVGRALKEGKGIGKIGKAGKALISREGQESGRETVGKVLEKMHVVRPGWYEENRRERMGLDKEVKRLDKLPTERLNEIMERTTLTGADLRAQISAFEVLSKRRSIGGEEGTKKEKTAKKMIARAKIYGADVGETLKARPDWAKEIGKTIKEQVESRSPKQFRDEAQPEALKNIEVFLTMDVAKLKDIGIRGNKEQKNVLRELLKINTSTQKKIFQKARAAYDAQGRPTRESRRIVENIKEVRGNPNFRL